MKHLCHILLILICITPNMLAEEKEAYLEQRHELRIGWGDQLFESLMWHNPTTIITMPPSYKYKQTYHENYKHNQHLWLEYQWRHLSWLSFGAMVDISEVGWNDITRDGQGNELSRSKRKYFYNLAFMPTIRFTYYHHPYVNIYSGFGFGMDINGGTETNAAGKRTDIGMAINVTAIGVSANYNRWFMAADFGGLTALRNSNVIFMAASRIMNFSIGVRF